jgi:sugar phosphate isomerase/epimerase
MVIRPALFSKVFGGRELPEAATMTAELVYDGFEPMCREPHLDADLVHVHVKDLCRVADGTGRGTFELETDAGTETFQRQPLGKGDVDHGPLFEAPAAAGYDGHAAAESTFAPDGARAAAVHELEELRRLLGS